MPNVVSSCGLIRLVDVKRVLGTYRGKQIRTEGTKDHLIVVGRKFVSVFNKSYLKAFSYSTLLNRQVLCIRTNVKIQRPSCVTHIRARQTYADNNSYISNLHWICEVLVTFYTYTIFKSLLNCNKMHRSRSIGIYLHNINAVLFLVWQEWKYMQDTF